MTSSRYIRAIRRDWAILIATTLLGLSAGAVYTLMTPPLFRASADVFVSTTGSTPLDLNQGGAYTQQVVKSYADLVTTSYVLDPVVHELGLRETAAQLAQSIRATVPLDTSFVHIEVTASSSASAAAIANAVSTSLPRVVTPLVSRTSAGAPVKLTRVQQAIPPTRPIAPNVPASLTLAALCGALVGAAVSWLRTRADNRVRRPEDVSSLTDLPVLAVVDEDDLIPEQPLALLQRPSSRVAEQYRSLRTNLRFTAHTKPPRSLVVTSALAQEGKTTTALNMAVAAAQTGARVLLVDADLRRPAVAGALGLEGAVGLTDVLIGSASVEDALQRAAEDHITVVTAGTTAPNPSELLGSRDMDEVLRAFEDRFDLTILDSPPLLPVSDAAVLSRIVDGAVVVCGLSRPTRAQFLAAMSALRQVGAHVYGVVVTLARHDSGTDYLYGNYVEPRRERQSRAG